MNTKYKVWFGYDLGCEQYVWDTSYVFYTKGEAELYMHNILSQSNQSWDTATIEEVHIN